MRSSSRAGAPSPRRARDRGQTLVEILVAIVLLGTAVGGTLTALRTTIVSGAIDDDQAKAQLWLQSARDAIYRTPYMECPTRNAAEVKAAYDLAVQAATPPDGWADGSVGVNVVHFWSKADGKEVWGDACGTDTSVQRVEIYVLSPDGDVGRTVQVIKGG